MNPEKPEEIKRLRNASRYSYTKLLPFRTKRLEWLKQFATNNYGENAANRKTVMPYLTLGVQIITRLLAANAPQCLVTAKAQHLKDQVANWEIALNQLLRDIEYQGLQDAAVLDAMFGLGLLKLGQRPDYKDGRAEPRIFSDVVDLDDWVHDVKARRWVECAFMGHRYRLDLEDAKQDPRFDSKVAGKLEPTPVDPSRDGGGERAENISGDDTEEGKDAQVHEQVELCELFLPKEKLLVTYAWYDEDAQPLAVQKWTGPAHGPYHRLCFEQVPSNVMPLPPVALWYELHELSNVLWRKIGNQATRQKNYTAYRASGSQDAERIKGAKDGEMIRMDDPEGVQERSAGGVDPRNLALAIQLKQFVSFFGGNWESLGGLSPQADTLGQDQLLKASSSAQIEKMAERVVAFDRAVIRDLAWYVAQDPDYTMDIKKGPEGYEVPVKFQPGAKGERWLDLNIDIEPYSLRHNTPQMRLNTIMQITQGLLLPAMPLLMEQGIQVDMAGLLRLISKYSNTPELEDILVFSDRMGAQETQEHGDRPRQSPVTRRENVRVNRSTARQEGQESEMVRALLGSAQGNGNYDSLMRAVG